MSECVQINSTVIFRILVVSTPSGEGCCCVTSHLQSGRLQKLLSFQIPERGKVDPSRRRFQSSAQDRGVSV